MKLESWNDRRIDALVQLWNQEIGKHFPMRKELFKQNSFEDENICEKASAIAIDEENHVVGFVVAKRYQEKKEAGMSKEIGWIQVLLVAENRRDQGIGSLLLANAETHLKAAGVKQILLGRDPWHYFPGIPMELAEAKSWFEQKGYQNSGIEHDMIRKYHNDDVAAVPKITGIECQVLKLEDKDLFLDFLHRCFPGRWEYEAIHYFQKGGTGREFAILKKGQQIIGFCRMNDEKSPFIAQNVYWAPLFQEELGGVGPLGVDANERGKGYGLAVVEAGIGFLRERGVSRIVIDWTGLTAFYNKLGYTVWKSYAGHSKDL
ncbi:MULTISPECIES: GNAT family N-acetyltransferase [Oceanobacillus]|uniref:GNAT family N-acetyltransferase n=1 Tax=Oceanobacillus aidingensis TaxID=645964 RepID=A0ABV9JVP8_9BACI|nr:GNAT family N-acetyltransferase [Oceanobacillus oncorhynchi]MDM8102051.1 GNAT family N-acetyltransferase [Oceanobacillus oncorhynchi]